MVERTRRAFITLVGGAAAASSLSWPLAARAQQPGKTHTVGYLSPATYEPEFSAVSILPATLRELGWVEGKNLAIERRYADNRLDRLPALAAELVALKVDIIAAFGTLGPLAAKQATTTIPVVMMAAGDPLGSGLIASLARPGGNVTGMSLMAPELGGKRLELLQEVVPGLTRVAVLWNASNPYSSRHFKETQAAAPSLGITAVQSLEVRGADDFAAAFAAAKRERPQALIVVEDPFTFTYRKPIIDFATGQRLPALYGIREFVQAEGLMCYGASLADLYRRAAGYVDKILKGAKPADLPVQQPTKFELVINLRTAKALGLQLPEKLVALADEVIE